MPQTLPRKETTTPPLVFISYARKDAKWRDRLHVYLKPAVASGRIAVWDDKFLKTGEGWSGQIDAAMDTAAVAVLLVSPDYLASEWVIRSEAPRLLRLMEEGRIALIPILLRACAWQAIGWLRNIQMFPQDAKPLTSRPSAGQDKLFFEAAELIVRAATEVTSHHTRATTPSTSPPPRESPQPKDLSIDWLARYVLSDDVRAIVHRARVLATFGKKEQHRITTSCLLFGIAEGGRNQTDSVEAVHFLWREIQRADATGYSNIFRERFPNARYSSTDETIDFDLSTEAATVITSNVLRVFQLAENLSSGTLREAPVQSSNKSGSEARYEILPEHLLAALLTFESTRAFVRLSKIIDVTLLRGKFLTFISHSLPKDVLDKWRIILDPEGPEVTASTAGGIPLIGEAIDATEADDDSQAPLAGFLTDYWGGEDLLGITSDVNALASLVAACSVDPPLSIGLFGDWGSGKTHFMKQMKARVEKLSQKTRASQEPQSKLGYYRNIVQIEFNAWHYIEGNLWASLVEHIFNNLRVPDPKSRKDGSAQVEDARLVVMEQLGLKKELQAKIEKRQEELKVKGKDAKGRADKAKNKRDDTSQDLVTLRDNPATAVINQLTTVELSAEQKELLEGLGISVGTMLLPGELHKRYQEAQGMWSKIRAQWSLFRADKKLFKKSLTILGVLAVTAVVSFFARKYFTVAITYVASIVTFVVTFGAAARPYYEKFKQGMATLKGEYDKIEQERQKQIVQLENEVNVLTRQYKEAEDEAKTINKEVADLQLQLDETTVTKILAGFIEDRAACTDYRRHLGVLALIRRDFEKLSDLLSEQRKVHHAGEVAKDGKAIDRIILYIDDLDRCPPGNVVQVLQAVHLLLAFPLFVVVVGVDARWVTHSLQESYEWLNAEDDNEKETHEDKKEQTENRLATPHDYLEKIFQIPFWLRPMEDKDCKNLVEGLTRDSRVAKTPPGSQTPPAEVVAAERLAPDVQSQRPAEVPTDESVAHRTEDGATAESIQQDLKVAQAGQEAAADPRTKSEAEEADDDPIDLAPRSLTLADIEIEYMKDLTKLIGRSPRSVKRFLNCYRLMKVGLRASQLEAFLGRDGQNGEFKAVMILLGVITGAPSISLYFIEELEKYSSNPKVMSMDQFLLKLDGNPEVSRQPDWLRVRDFLEERIGSQDSRETLAALIKNVPRVSRYSFKVARVEAAGKRRAVAAAKSL